MVLHGKSSNIASRARGRDVYLPFQLEKERTIFSKRRCKNLLFNFESVLTPKGPGFSDYGGEGAESAFLCNFVIEDQ